LLLLVGALTLFHWAILILGLPVLERLPRWFFPLQRKPGGAVWLLALMVAVSLVVLLATVRVRRRYGPKLVVLMLLGVGLQWGFGLVEGRGARAISDRMAVTGHAEFARVAVRLHDRSIPSIVSGYESLVDAGELGLYASAKPPGQLLLYVATQRAADLLDPRDSAEGRLDALRVFATAVWPFLGYLVLIPLFWVGRSLGGPRTALSACVLYLFLPSVNLINLHTDQVFFPLFFTTGLLLTIRSMRRGRLPGALGAGAFLYLAVFCSFSLLVLGLFVPALSVWLARDRVTGRRDVRRLVTVLLGVGLGALIVDGAFRLAFGYDVIERFQRALEAHVAWKGWKPRLDYHVYFGCLNLLEYAVWIGVPVATLLVAAGLTSVRAARRHRLSGTACLTGLVLLCLLLLAFFGRTKGEVARLWLFLAPCICLAVAAELLRRYGRRSERVLILVVGLQGVTVYLTKVFQDFW